MNHKSSGQRLASQAAKTMHNNSASNMQRSLAASVLAQSNTNKQTGSVMESVASKVLSSPKYGDLTKAFAASVLSQSQKER